MNINDLNLKFLLILFLNLPILSSIISIPFNFDILSQYKNYNLTYFFLDTFKKEIIIKFGIGTPLQKIKSKINQESPCLLFKKDNSSINENKFFPFNSSSFSIKGEAGKNVSYKTGIDQFYLGENIQLSFILDNYTYLANEKYIPIIGLNIPLILLGNFCPNFILDLKLGKIINKLIWSLKYNNRYDGEFIIGDELSEYNPNKYNKSKYSTIYLNSEYIFNFDSVYIQDKQYKKDNNLIKYKFNITDVHLNINSGFIIGTQEYKDYIDKNYFNYLVNRSICKIDIIKYNSENNNNDNNNIDKNFYNKDFYVYSCYTRAFTGKKSERFPSPNYYEEFPNLILSSKKLEYNFELINKDLFEQIFDKYYFLIIFEKDKKEKGKEIWHLGEPFYKKYTFTINPDAKTIGFYIDKLKTNNKIINDTNVNNNNNNNNKTYDNIIEDKNDNFKINNIIKYIIEIIFVIILVFIAYYIGVTVKERRRKRANELKDDNYEYLPEKNKNINDKQNDLKNQQFVELNSRLGL